MIDRSHDLPIVRQAKALNISRGSVYYQPRPESAGDLGVMRRIKDIRAGFKTGDVPSEDLSPGATRARRRFRARSPSTSPRASGAGKIHGKNWSS